MNLCGLRCDKIRFIYIIVATRSSLYLNNSVNDCLEVTLL